MSTGGHCAHKPAARRPSKSMCGSGYWPAVAKRRANSHELIPSVYYSKQIKIPMKWGISIDIETIKLVYTSQMGDDEEFSIRERWPKDLSNVF